MMNLVSDKLITSRRRTWLYKTGGAAALITGFLFLMGIISLQVSILQPGSLNTWFFPLQNNWLIVIFKIHAGFDSLHADLVGLNILDIIFLCLVVIVCLSFGIASNGTGKIWAGLPFVLSLAAIILYVSTQNAGRSTVMLVVLIMSFLMLRSKKFNNANSFIGILSGILLFVGDLSVGIQSNLITILFSIGYILLIVWFMMVAQVLFRLGMR